jgi:uncharacterized protein
MNAFVFQFIFGLGSSLHCVGMCGPINFILPLDKNDKIKIALELLVYHTGRILTYAFIGMAIGLLGNLLAFRQIQSYVSFIFGFLLLLYGLNYFINVRLPLYFSKRSPLLLKKYNSLLKSNSKSNIFLLGSLNGILPCGMVYAAMAVAFLDKDIINGGLMMLSFGLGTAPALVLLIMGSKNKSLRTLASKYQLQPVLMIIAGLFVCIKSTATILPPQTALWQSILNPIMCH